MVRIRFEVPHYTTKETLIADVLAKMTILEDDMYAEKIRGSITWKDEEIDLGVGRIKK